LKGDLLEKTILQDLLLVENTVSKTKIIWVAKILPISKNSRIMVPEALKAINFKINWNKF
jgi:hypothetical protein